jgi:hypothetical protein
LPTFTKGELVMFSAFRTLADSMENITEDGGIKKRVSI